MKSYHEIDFVIVFNLICINFHFELTVMYIKPVIQQS